MEKVYVGKIVSTHGVKGEIRIISEFPFKDKVFIINNKIIIDDKEYTIKSYRHHKIYDMVTLDDYKDINEVLFLMKKKVYVEKNSLNLTDNEVLDEELITYTVITTTGSKGYITEIFKASPTNKIIRIKLNDKEILVPIKSDMIKNINKKEKTLTIELLKGM